ncbi:Six-bladed beta-propeller TolB-like protein [Neofusicoccum parvum]|uniref:Six-bladed beta-propeller TolB-like protein n=2 Tax=Neofusicoccum parvum TaxID=310453 RepID=A0ACB5SJ00_9PEZI|nr:putative six-bladed beta-propeller -like protein [Neofusicoccum parvum UCRNP2]GME43337.1 Six-bladed beta-propeller TolB-like protein [Neofusicoccum parvum]GME64133.1 Six-bladed beta-propeller TolB-like protein [Neofusicoccum parvum]
MFSSKSISLLLALVSSATASPLLTARNASTRQVYQFEQGTWVENLAVRQNGNLLVDLVDRPEIYEINPSSNESSPKLVHRFPGITSVFGISEVSTDVFTVVGGNFSLATFSVDAESFGVWQVDLTGSEAAVSQIAAMPDAVFLNGMTTLNSQSVLVSDSTSGVVYRVDIQTGEYTIVLDDETMKPPADATLQIGVNGIRLFNGYLYYLNLFAKLYCRVPIDSTSGKAVGPYEVIAENVYADDFAITQQGVAYAADGFENQILKVTLDGQVESIAGNLNSTTVAGATSAQFGKDGVLYVTTGGALAAPVNGTYTEGGKIVALRV